MSYLRSLEALYEQWFARYDRSPALVIETDRLDYVTRLWDRHEVLRAVDAHLGVSAPLPGVGAGAR